MFVHVRVPEVEGKVSILKIPSAQIPDAARDDIGKAIDAFSSTSRSAYKPDEIFERNFFMIIQFIPRPHVSGRAKCIGCTDTYLTYVLDGFPDLLFCKWSDLIRPYTAGNSQPDKESYP